MEPSTKKSSELTLHDRLSPLTYRQACKLLGEEGEKLIQRGGAWDIDINEQVELNNEFFSAKLPATSKGENGQTAVVTIRRATDERDCLQWKCSICPNACEHMGAAFSLLLEDKMALGLAAAPPERVPLESLSDDKLVEQALREREERARSEKMILRSVDSNLLWTDIPSPALFLGRAIVCRSEAWNEANRFAHALTSGRTHWAPANTF